MTTNTYIHGFRHHRWQQFNRKLWQRNYYERVIRDEVELHAVRSYIQGNPVRYKR